MAADVPSSTLVKAPGASPERWIVFLHGILGRGNNWRGIARQLVKDDPHWGAVLVDLRAHGDSRELAPPDTLDAAADDVVRLARTLPGELGAVLGHSFGGKVALAMLGRIDLPRLLVVDSLPGARPDRRGSEGTIAVIETLRALPAELPSRDAFIAHVAAHHGEEIAKWLAMSLDRTEHGVRFGLDVARITALLDGYFTRDLWPAIDPPPAGTIVDLVIGGRSSVYSEDDREHARQIASRHPEAVRVHVLEKAAHWVHVDDPEGLIAIVRDALEGR
jgi:pimeloyl-ACP methyl ester carboxylesterase